ncbi:hypothetical protein EAH81_06835 [Flavobacterium pectinovorum]|uniref:Uncharacterized protein n=1 Tax=Flavobacterium pectinovorum TaxID=29533 RepID=A0A502EYE0_9FLAO|nr:hypothetical protein EAH81_06835 [Flavobacterium pectinovorum]
MTKETALCFYYSSLNSRIQTLSFYVLNFFSQIEQIWQIFFAQFRLRKFKIRSAQSAQSARKKKNLIFRLSTFVKVSLRIFVIPRHEGSPQDTPQSKSPIFVELLTEIPRASG